MNWPAEFLYDRIVARDRTFDGRFLTGVTTTGIYCLPSCPARKPKFCNVRFDREPEEALADGLRACRRCRPDLFYRGEDWDRALFEGLLRRLRADPGAFRDARALAAACGVSATKLAELTRAYAGLAPAALLRRERIAAACAMLARGSARVIDIGLAVGFGSSASFHRQFVAQTGLTPAAYRSSRQS